MKDIKEVRKKINEIDQKMLDLFEQRMGLAKEVAFYKKEHALPIYDKLREKEIIEKNLNSIENEELKDFYIGFIQNIMDVSKDYQRRLLEGMNVAYCGIEGAFSYIASKKLFKESKLVSFSSFTEAYESVVNGKCDTCVLPLENSTSGDVGEVLDLLFSGSLYVNNIINIEIIHNLIVKKGTKLQDIKRVASHQQALSQCDKYIQQHNFETIKYSNTAIAAKDLADSDYTDLAVIASKEVAELYGLEILETNINEMHNNTTRFAVFSRSLNTKSHDAKMGQHFILTFTVLNEAGALAKTLNIIGSHGYNMRTLRSRPMKELLWNYYFFIEADGNINTKDGQEMINELKSVCDRLKVVGAYYSHAER